MTDLPAGLTVGPAGAGDVDELTALCRARADEAGSSTFTSREGFEEILWIVAEKKFPCEIVVVRRDGALVGAADAFRLETPVTADAWVHPSARDQELITWLIEWTEGRVRDMAKETETSVPLWHRTHVYDVDVRSVLEERGYHEIRSFFRMEGQLGAHELPRSVREIDIRTLGPAETEARGLHAVIEESFSEHFGYEPMSFERFWAMWSDSPTWDPESIWIAWDGDRPVGALIATEEGINVGYVNVLGVLKPYRGRGIAKALLATSFSHFRNRGRSTVALGVDSENATGATRLYERVGMHVATKGSLYETHVFPG